MKNKEISILKDGAEYITMLVIAAIAAVYGYCYYKNDVQVNKIIEDVMLELKNINNL